MSSIMTSRLAAELDHAFERNGWNAKDVKSLSEGNKLSKILDVLQGRSRIVPLDGSGKIADCITEFLIPISCNYTLSLAGTTGSKIIADAKDVFAVISPEFRDLKIDESWPAKKLTPVAVYEVIKNGTFSDIFASANDHAQKLCLTQHQIIDFVVKYREWIKDDPYSSTSFLFKNDGVLYVATIGVYPDRALGIGLYNYHSDRVVEEECGRRIILPQLFEL